MRPVVNDYRGTVVRRIGQIMRLREGARPEYERCHAEIWDEVRQALLDCGIRNYTIFCYGLWLFSYFELPDGVRLEDVHRIASQDPHCRQWEETMHRLQEPLPESSGHDWWGPMDEIWHLEDETGDGIEFGKIVIGSLSAEQRG
jgi:L-rhamnose mutarotase